MDDLKILTKDSLIIFNKLVGEKFNNIFFQYAKPILGDNIFVINFGSRIKYSFQIACFLRIRVSNKIILTSSDEFANKQYKQVDAETYNAFKEKNFSNGSLLKKTLSNVKQLLKGAVVKNVLVNEIADVTIEFDNSVIIEVKLDCQMKDYEYYRFFKYSKGNPHYVVYYDENICVRLDENLQSYETFNGDIVSMP